MNDRMDLTPLDPSADAALFERLVSAVVADAVAARSSRPPVPPTLLDLTRWTRPLLALAAGIAVVAGATIYSVGPDAAPAELPAESIGIPRAMATWVERGDRPSAAALVAAFGEVRRQRALREQP